MHLDIYARQKPEVWTEELIFEYVKIILEEALNPSAKITPQARILIELEGESIDLLDIFFRTEKAFGIRVSRETDLPDPDGLIRGLHEPLSTEAIVAIVDNMPFLKIQQHQLTRNMSFADIFTVDSYCRLISKKLDEKYPIP